MYGGTHRKWGEWSGHCIWVLLYMASLAVLLTKCCSYGYLWIGLNLFPQPHSNSILIDIASWTGPVAGGLFLFQGCLEFELNSLSCDINLLFAVCECWIQFSLGSNSQASSREKIKKWYIWDYCVTPASKQLRTGLLLFSISSKMAMLTKALCVYCLYIHCGCNFRTLQKSCWLLFLYVHRHLYRLVQSMIKLCQSHFYV